MLFTIQNRLNKYGANYIRRTKVFPKITQDDVLKNFKRTSIPIEEYFITEFKKKIDQSIYIYIYLIR